MKGTILLSVLVAGCALDELAELGAGEVYVVEGDPQAGQRVFEDNCEGCHGDTTLATAYLCDRYVVEVDLSVDRRTIVDQVTDGSDCMPGFGSGTDWEVELTELEIADVAAYVDETW